MPLASCLLRFTSHPSQFRYNEHVKPRILLLHAAAGAGHRRAAEAVAASLRRCGATVAVHDAIPYTHPIFRAFYVGGGLGMITRLPRLYGVAYRMADRPTIDRVLRGPRHQAQRISAQSLLKAIRVFAPDAIICTHFLPAELCAGWRRSAQLTIPAYTVVTDFEPHRFWQHAGIDGYCVASDDAADRLARDGVDRSTIAVTGIPIPSDFADLPDRSTAFNRLQLDPDRLLLLLMGGGLGVGGIEPVARSLIGRPIDAQVAIITGSNQRLRRRLRRMSNDWIVRGFVDNMPEWLAAADVAISKAGGLTASELMAASVPTVIPRGLTGHETHNALYMALQGAAALAESSDDAVEQAMRLLADSEARAGMRLAAARSARPYAADTVAEYVLREARLDTKRATRNTLAE